MIQNIIVSSSNKAEKNLLPKNDTLIIKVGMHKLPVINYDYLYFDSLALSFTADILPSGNSEIITNTQAQKIIKRIKKAQQTSKPIDILICCDSKNIISSAIALFTKETYPNAKLMSRLSQHSTVKFISNFLKMNSYRHDHAIFKYTSSMFNFKLIGHSLVTIAKRFKRNPKRSLKALLNWVKQNF